MGMADAGDRVAARRSCSALCLRRGLADGTARRQPRRAGYAGCQIATQTRIDAAALAHNVSGGNKELAKALIWNGPVDAWRHAEWNRRMASDPQVGSTFAAIVGVGHEVQNLYEKITGQGAPGQTWTQFAQESIMDLSNNRLGRTQAELGAQVISLSDPGISIWLRRAAGPAQRGGERLPLRVYTCKSESGGLRVGLWPIPLFWRHGYWHQSAFV